MRIRPLTGRRRWTSVCLVLGGWALAAFTQALTLGAQQQQNHPVSYSKWLHGPSADPDFFPLAVWLQSPANADRFRKAGINTYVGLWQGPTEAQLAELKRAGIKVICEQNEVALRHVEDATIVAWMHGDEPDNAQSLGARLGWGSPVAPEKIVTDYRRLHDADPTRPVILNLGQGVAWDGWYGRGNRTGHPEDYPQYLEGCDIASFDIYPAVHDSREVAGKLWYVGQGVERLVRWSGGKRIVWNCLECTRISNVDRKPTPHQVRCEAWMALIRGSRGLIYFVHQFKPNFREAALLDDPEMLAAVTALNQQIIRLAPVLNSPEQAGLASARSSKEAIPIAYTTRESSGTTWIFAVPLREGEASVTFSLQNSPGDQIVEVLDENRSLTAHNGAFSDRFGPWEVHLYKISH